ncbi:signal peptidase I [Rhizobium sp. LEGMi198b]|uniref:signal peptidase I n=2 Tax=Rhizobium TaxID=379 RepID=UPI000CF29A76|nr:MULTISPECIES: signal peptidase I [unclassified Rhizobium]MDK4739854.1 signal peptidase I [Rhizobium sp. CNPSo 3464]
MRFFRFFRDRRPLAVIIIGLLLGPAVVMAYLGRGRIAISYLLLTNLVGALAVLAMPQLALVTVAGLVAVPFNLIGCIHGYWLMRRGAVAWQHRWFSRWYNIALLFWLLPLVVAFTIRTFIIQPFSIPSGSMMPTLMPGSYAFVTKFNYGYGRYSFSFRPNWVPPKLFGSKPQRGDVVMLVPPTTPNVDYAKRVIGLPGDRVQMKNGIVFINGQSVPRDAEGTIVSHYSLDPGEFPVFGEVLDNGVRYQTLDELPNSRGDNTREYSVPEGYYFVLGDNRDNSNDSRFDVGFVPEANIYGKFWLVFRPEGGWSFVH